jgi:surfactin synthase thioesterase subunit
LMTELPAMLDRPYAVFGHCLGGLTGYETVRHLVRHGLPTPRHIFVSGARPPDRLSDAGQFEERLTRDLLALATFQITAPPHLQPDDVFTEIIRHFEIATSEEMLADTALRHLMLPVVRAEFAMAGTYRFTPTAPWDIPITCFAAKGDPYVARRHALGWGRFTNARLQLHIREGKHFAVLDDKAFITGMISREMLAADQLAP